ncbi:response regulator transcription factor [Tepidibacillus fermentans]|uniref:Winged helix family two component transcriptional regulator n=1 Tax=Tepidibacillus fermentans TaxID=1281767 RepID=A0A4R3KB49_9BACI|nr:response regulator transcription factor [Tepidibacillus fermentans]TCS79891.1 winged helix family two component transcriptional regulator [Tepidibacillus fermentans]
MKNVILIADDDERIRSVVKLYLEAEDYTVIEVDNGQKVLDVLEKQHIDLLLLDLMMPVLDGWTVTKFVRKNLDIPIIMITAKGEENDRILGLELGADDYIVKPFSPREVVARVKTVLRRAESSSSDSHVYKVKNLTVNVITRQVLINDEEVKFTLKEFDILHYLVKSPGRIVTREELLEQVWGFDYIGDSRTVDTHMNRLRDKIDKNGGDSSFIHTVRGVGYKFLPNGQ